MNHLLKKKEKINKRLDELRNHPAAKQPDRREWLSLTEPIFADRVRIDKKLDEERSMLAHFANAGLLEIVKLCAARECVRASALARILQAVVSGMYSDEGVELEHVRSMVSEYKERFTGDTAVLEVMERKLADATVLETESSDPTPNGQN